MQVGADISSFLFAAGCRDKPVFIVRGYEIVLVTGYVVGGRAVGRVARQGHFVGWGLVVPDRVDFEGEGEVCDCWGELFLYAVVGVDAEREGLLGNKDGGGKTF